MALVGRDTTSSALEDQGKGVEELWREVKGWRGMFSWKDAFVPFIFGFLPSLWDVFSDYSYADTWDTGFLNITDSPNITMVGNDRKLNKMFKNFTYMFIWSYCP